MLNIFEKKTYITLIVHRVYVSNYYTIFHDVYYFFCEMLKYLPRSKYLLHGISPNIETEKY